MRQIASDTPFVYAVLVLALLPIVVYTLWCLASGGQRRNVVLAVSILLVQGCLYLIFVPEVYRSILEVVYLGVDRGRPPLHELNYGHETPAEEAIRYYECRVRIGSSDHPQEPT